VEIDKRDKQECNASDRRYAEQKHNNNDNSKSVLEDAMISHV